MEKNSDFQIDFSQQIASSVSLSLLFWFVIFAESCIMAAIQRAIMIWNSEQIESIR